MYVGRFTRNADQKGEAMIMSDFIFSRLDKNLYKEELENQYNEYLKRTGKSYFSEEISEAYETDAQGEALTLTAEELADNEDELIRIMHQRFLNGEDTKYFNYAQEVDNNPKYDHQKQIDQDEEDRWFDEEEPSSGYSPTRKANGGEEHKQSQYTGELDY